MNPAARARPPHSPAHARAHGARPRRRLRAGALVETRQARRHEGVPRLVVKVAAAAIAFWLTVRLSSLLVELFVALLLTAALDPLVGRLERRGWPRLAATGLVLGALVGMMVLLLLLVVPPLVADATRLVSDLPRYTAQARRFFGGNAGLYDQALDAANQAAADPAVVAQALALGSGLLSGVTALLVILAMTGYLLVDGERVYFWATRALPPRQRAMLRRTLPEISRVVGGYLVGQVVTSLVYGLFAYAVLTAFGVPQALLLAVLAALADAVPIVGPFLAAGPSVLLALTVSLPTAAAVLVANLAYQQFEQFYLVPRVYRGTLRISSFAVLVALLVGAQLLGLVGALLALPVAAAIPAIERIWTEEPAAKLSPPQTGRR